MLGKPCFLNIRVQEGNNRSPGRKSWVIVIGASESRRDGTTLTSRRGCCFSRPPEMQALAPRRRQLYSRPALRDDSAQPRTERNRGPRFAPVLRELEWAAESWVAKEKHPSSVGTVPDSPAFQGWGGYNNNLRAPSGAARIEPRRGRDLTGARVPFCTISNLGCPILLAVFWREGGRRSVTAITA